MLLSVSQSRQGIVVTCSKVRSPDTKNVVDMMLAVAGSSSLIQSSGVMIRGHARVPENMTRYCWNPNMQDRCHGGVDSMSYCRPCREDMVNPSKSYLFHSSVKAACNDDLKQVSFVTKVTSVLILNPSLTFQLCMS